MKTNPTRVTGKSILVLGRTTPAAPHLSQGSLDLQVSSSIDSWFRDCQNVPRASISPLMLVKRACPERRPVHKKPVREGEGPVIWARRSSVIFMLLLGFAHHLEKQLKIQKWEDMGKTTLQCPCLSLLPTWKVWEGPPASPIEPCYSCSGEQKSRGKVCIKTAWRPSMRSSAWQPRDSETMRVSVRPWQSNR